MPYQDIHISDVPNWESVKTKWTNSQYQSMLDELDSSNLDLKVIDADMFNDICALVVETEEMYDDDPTFKDDKIQVSETPPTLPIGGVYFELTEVI